jgi:hypothetical protein
MYCAGCGYVLKDLPESRCPECARAFDPADPHTFREVPPHRLTPRQARAFLTFHWCLTVLSAGLTAPILNFGAAWLVLGHAPRVSLDDPKYIPNFGWLHAICGLWMIAAIPSTLLGALVPGYVAAASFPQRSFGWWLWRACMPPVVFVLSIIAIRYSQAGIIEWCSTNAELGSHPRWPRRRDRDLTRVSQ